MVGGSSAELTETVLSVTTPAAKLN
jgi:hypothetical protein